MRISISDIGTGVVAVCAIVICSIAIQKEFFAKGDPSAPRTVPNWQQLQRGGRRIGSTTIAPSIVEFGDFQCPFCAQAARIVETFARKYPDKFALAYYYYPLSNIHPAAFKAAEVAECAARQGRFEAAHNTLYGRSETLGHIPWDSIAVEAGVPSIEVFRKCVDGDSTRTIIEQEVILGRPLQFAGTPAFIINGTLYPNGLTEEDLKRKLLDAIK